MSIGTCSFRCHRHHQQSFQHDVLLASTSGWRGLGGAPATWGKERWRFWVRSRWQWSWKERKTGQHTPKGVAIAIHDLCCSYDVSFCQDNVSCTNPSYTQVLLPTIQEYEKFVRFGDSLLTRSSKLAELSQQLEDALSESKKGPESSESKKVKKYLDLCRSSFLWAFQFP